MEIIIEKAKKEQSFDILTVNKAAWYQAYKGIIDDQEMDEHFQERFSEDGIKRFENYVEKCKNFYVAIDRETAKIVGYIDFGMCKWDENYKEFGEVYAVYVFPELQRLGIGKKLLDFALNYFKEKEVSKVLLTTFQKNFIGLSFYKKNNFYVEKEFPKGTWHDNSVDEILLFKDL
ncbi:MAG: GNAT family N-acetyltransferase [Clostridia bacterium]|nr:GNAT family N-acetyltransferase [Clostridia bacterium]